MGMKVWETALVAAVVGTALPAHAVALNADGQWATFDVARDLSGHLGWIDIEDGEPLSFTFTVPDGYVATLDVVDAGFAGDRFRVLNGLQVLGDTSNAVNTYPVSIGLDFDAAWGDARYSRGAFTLASGAYDIGGLLVTSALDGAGMALDTTVGGVRLSVSPVPEPATYLMLTAGLALVRLARRR